MRATLAGVAAAAALAIGCANTGIPTGPTSSAISSGGGGVAGVLGAPPVSAILPGAGTGSAPTLGVGNSCPTDRPTVAVNENNGKIDLSVTPVAGQTRLYEWEVERERAGRWEFIERMFSYVTDGRLGLYAQPKTLGPGLYRVRARAGRTGCGAADNGTWSEWAPFSVAGPPAPPTAPRVYQDPAHRGA